MPTALPSASASLLTLVAAFLSTVPELAPAVALLQDQVQAHQLLGTVGTWQGGTRAAALDPAVHGADRRLLLHALEYLAAHAPSLEVFLAQSLLAHREANLAAGAVGQLIAAREDIRRLEAEIASPASVRRVEPLLAQLSALKEKLPGLVARARGLDTLRRRKRPSIVDAMETHYAPTPSLHNLWVSKLQVVKKIHGHRKQAFCVAVQDKWIVTGADDGLVKLWNGNTGNLHAALRGHTAEITDLATTDTLVCSCSEDRTIRVWELATGRAVAVMNHHKDGVQRVSFVDDRTLVSSGDDGACCVWDVGAAMAQLRVVDQALADHARIEEARRAQNLPATPAPALPPVVALPPLVFPHLLETKQGNVARAKVFCHAVHPARNLVVTGSLDSVVRVWSIKPLEDEPGFPHIVAPTQPGLVTGAYEDGAAHLVMRLSDHTAGVVQRVEWSKRGDRLLTFASRDPAVRVWTWPSGSSETRFRIKPRSLVLSALASPSTDSKGKKLPVFVHSAAWTCDDARVITSQSLLPKVYLNEPEGFWDQRTCVWDAVSGSLLWSLRAHRRQAGLIRPHPTLPHIVATGGEDGLVVFWDVEAGRQVRVLDMVGSVGYPDVTDGQWTVGCAAVDFCVTDSLGRLMLIGTGEGMELRAAFVEQFMANETAALVHDHWGNARDANTGQELHWLPRAAIVDAEGEAYPVQPPPVPQGQGAFTPVPYRMTADEVRANRETRRAQVKLREAVLAGLEETARQSEQAKFATMDEAVARARARDVEGDAAVAAAAAAKPWPKKPRSGGAVNGAAAPSAARRRNGALTLVNLVDGADDDEDDEEDDEDEGRTRRKAARKATRRIKAAQSDEDDDDDSAAGAAESPRGDGPYEGRHRRNGGDDDDDMSLSGSSSSASSSGSRNRGAGDSDDDDDDDSAVSSGEGGGGRVGTRRTARRANAPPVSYAPLAEPAALLRDIVPVDASWLLLDKTSAALYVPQAGDSVVYVVRGHQSFLARFPSSSAGSPWAEWDAEAWPVVRCDVEGVEYVYPDEDELRDAPEGCPAVCRCRLRVTHVPVEDGSALVAHPAGPRFIVAYRCSEAADFIVPEDRFSRGMAEAWKPGDVAWALFGHRQASELELYQGEVAAVNADWRKRPWEAVQVHWGGDTEPTWLSPWDLRRTNAVEADQEPVLSVAAQSRAADAIEAMDVARPMLEAPEHAGRPVFTPLRLVLARLRRGSFYRAWAEAEEDVARAARSFLVSGGPMSKAAIQGRAMENAALAALRAAAAASSGANGHEDDDDDDFNVPYAALSKALAHGLEQMRALDVNGFFSVPPLSLGLPAYGLLIARPMDLSTVAGKLQRRQYETSNRPPPLITAAEARSVVRRFIADVVLVCDNATFYNEAASPAHAAARQLEAFALAFAVDVAALRTDAPMSPVPKKVRRVVVRAPETAAGEAGAGDDDGDVDGGDGGDGGDGRRRAARKRKTYAEHESSSEADAAADDDDDDYGDDDGSDTAPRRSSRRAATAAAKEPMARTTRRSLRGRGLTEDGGDDDAGPAPSSRRASAAPRAAPRAVDESSATPSPRKASSRGKSVARARAATDDDLEAPVVSSRKTNAAAATTAATTAAGAEERPRSGRVKLVAKKAVASARRTATTAAASDGSDSAHDHDDDEQPRRASRAQPRTETRAARRPAALDDDDDDDGGGGGAKEARSTSRADRGKRRSDAQAERWQEPPSPAKAKVGSKRAAAAASGSADKARTTTTTAPSTDVRSRRAGRAPPSYHEQAASDDDDDDSDGGLERAPKRRKR